MKITIMIIICLYAHRVTIVETARGSKRNVFLHLYKHEAVILSKMQIKCLKSKVYLLKYLIIRGKCRIY